MTPQPTPDPAYGTHLPMLTRYVLATTGPVLELGCGEFSTPVLHALCRGRQLVSVEENPEWRSRFEGPLARDWHQFWDSYDDPRIVGDWSVVLIDHGPPERRGPDIARVADTADFIIAHDLNLPGHGYEAVLGTFRYRRDWLELQPTTVVLSNRRPP